MKPDTLQDVYELAPIQEGMLFHSLFAPESGVYVEQLTFTLRGTPDREAFRRAWQDVVDRHPILRTGFHWEEVGKSLQAVHRHAELRVEEVDWRGLPEEEQDRRYREFTAEHRRRGFDLRRPPLMRVALVRLGDDLHRLFWSFPHLVMDGWSFGLVLQEFAESYAARARGAAPSLAPTRPYRDYVAWWKGRDLGKAEEFWRRTLSGYEPPGALEIGPRPPGDDGPSHAFVPDRSLGSLVRDLDSLARDNRLTLNTLVQGAWMMLLSRYTGRADVISGATSTHRPADLPGAGTIVGPMITTTPVRARIDPERPLLPWLRQLQDEMTEAREFADVPLHLFHRWAGLPGGGVPLFETDLAFENTPAPEMALYGLEIVDFAYDGRPHYPLTMVVFPQEGLPPRLVHDRRRFAEPAAERLTAHFHEFLAQMAAAPGGRLGDIEPYAPEERIRLLSGGHEPRRIPDAPCLHEIFADQAARTPDATALVCGGDRLTYRELDERANRLARRLQELGAAPEERVGLCLERSADQLVAILGVLKSGAAYVPLDLAQPAARMAQVLGDAGARILVTHAAASDRVPADTGPVVDLDRDAGEIAALDASAPESGAAPENLAYVLFTSGSTGRPKGVELTHAHVVRLVRGAETLFEVGPDDVWSMFHSYAFDVSVFETWGAFATGGRLVVVDRDTARSPEALHALLGREGVTVFSQTPSAFRPYARHALDHEGEQPPLRYVIFAGEYLDVPSLAPWIERFGDAEPRLVNMYGITEITVHATFHRVTAADVDSGVRSCIGRPLPDLRIHLLDPHGRPVPPGVCGEIHVSGPGVARGYRGLPEQTAERFLDDPFAGDGSRMYRSGDLARLLDDGTLEVLGRADDQVKIRGFRVEPGEVAAALSEHPGVREVLVTAREQGPGDVRLVAYAVPSGDGAGGEELDAGLRALARDRLPEYMAPSAVVVLDELPLTANGKVDRRALPAPDGRRPDAAGEYTAPRDELETEIARVWAEVLGVDRVGAHDDFFALGGHSLLATRVAGRLRAALDREVRVRTLFDQPVLSALAEALRETRAAPAAEGPALVARPRTPARRPASRKERS
ncbi:amino acid adenylation domain-containing protein [Streptomyces sp. WMMC1477]|uniref:amino acid adenylation domain-containing protein n=1 Tax=Streptomyces sp. WMMC1477 TaxID=3015155 RepID=UPI0022B620F3|nr:amino acid adenylation domain-containing protein [Streptomyces sp. WMMC1477]MCZ7434492.1 amino acid adenylation domain-containing protein [Streptomyces sp. WMMC1477]